MLCTQCGKNPAAKYTVTTEEGELNLMLCPECYRELTKSAERDAYTVFREELAPAIMQVQGKMRHEGKTPNADASQNYPLARELETLREEMERLLREKNFAAAKKLNARLMEINHKLYRGEEK